MKRHALVVVGALALLCMMGPVVFAAAGDVGWVGGLFPATSEINGSATATFDIYCQVYKDGCTPGAGACAQITHAQIYFGEVSSFGSGWSNIKAVNMTYNTEIGNNDEYKGTLSLAAGDIKAFQRYEYICRFSDDNGTTFEYNTDNGGSNGRLTVLGPNAVALNVFGATPIAAAWPLAGAAIAALGGLGGLALWRRRR